MMSTTTTRTNRITAFAVVLLASIATSIAKDDPISSLAEPKEGPAFHSDSEELPFFQPLPNADGKLEYIPVKQQPAASSSSLRGSGNDPGLELPPIPPIHPVHRGAVHYSSTMTADGAVTYRRDIQAPCDNGMLVFNIGPSKDDLPFHYDVYADAYLYSNNAGLCILYPTYTGYQTSTYGPFWRPGFDPTTIVFGDLVAGPRHMHRVSSRVLAPPKGAEQHSHQINAEVAGDYIIMGKHDFYDIRHYQKLKDYVNGWGPDGPSEKDANEFGWMIVNMAANDAESINAAVQ